MTGVLIRRGDLDTDTHRDVKPWKPQEEGGHLQAKDRYLTGEKEEERTLPKP